MNFGETLALVGLKAGARTDRFGIFAKAPPGFIHFGEGFFTPCLSEKTHFALDVGAVLEYYPSRHTVVRFDLGDTIIPYGGATFLDPLPGRQVRLGTIHHFQAGLGFGIRF